MFSVLLAILSASVLLPYAAGAPQAGDAAWKIHPNGDTSKCLDVRGAVFADGTPVQIYDCNGTLAQKWHFISETTSAGLIINVEGGPFCLDAGSNPANGVGMKIWTCYDGLPAQDWVVTPDNRIALLNQGQCLDLTNGVHVNSNLVQTWQCTANDANQVWTLAPWD
ncbi:putative G-X-X-X-Q-X-W domain-containing protein [Lyophyllum shimeji]|uniref:G-X-X-X-Q-X-W domain-containing protein n=1 Tax=Lyophyllum shimeji TaxID=47721 RepID=A0A9P3PJZ4_LYOSH|nr:putative G-X-X-X-Q-X-W domain-containing protein [Lyophyllum shimeji]